MKYSGLFNSFCEGYLCVLKYVVVSFGIIFGVGWINVVLMCEYNFIYIKEVFVLIIVVKDFILINNFG